MSQHYSRRRLPSHPYPASGGASARALNWPMGALLKGAPAENFGRARPRARRPSPLRAPAYRVPPRAPPLQSPPAAVAGTAERGWPGLREAEGRQHWLSQPSQPHPGSGRDVPGRASLSDCFRSGSTTPASQTRCSRRSGPGAAPPGRI